VESGQTPRASVAGYLVVLVGVAGWAVGCFLPLYHIPQLPNEVTITLYRQISFGSVWTKVGGLLYLFGGISAIGVISILGVLRIRTWTRFLLAGAMLAWFLVSIGVLISIGGSIAGFNPGGSLGVGYWCCWASIIVVVTGTIFVLVSTHREDEETGLDVSPAAGGDPSIAHTDGLQ
jgi:hypothetical protein